MLYATRANSFESSQNLHHEELAHDVPFLARRSRGRVCRCRVRDLNVPLLGLYSPGGDLRSHWDYPLEIGGVWHC